jgi:hypothetical protein
MSIFVKLIMHALSAFFVALALYFVWHVVAERASLHVLWLSALLVITVVGLVRRLAWGRFLVSAISVVFSLMVFVSLIPDLDDYYDEGGTVLGHMLGAMPPFWLSWVVVVGLATLPLIPAVIIGWRKSWFRSALW